MILAMAQMAMGNDMDENLAKSCALAKEARGADLLFFPELQHAPFLPQYHREELPEKIGKAAEDYLLAPNDARLQAFAAAAAKNQIALSPNLYLRGENGDYDTSLFFGKRGQLLGSSRMVHIFSAPRFYEEEYYTPAPDGFHVYATPFGKIGIVICFDRHFPESIRSCAAQGAQLVLVPTANHTREPLELFEQEIRVQAYQNGVFVAMCNRVGKEGDVTFAGESLVTSPDGGTLLKADGRERLILCRLDLAEAARAQEKRPYLTLRRKEQYV